MAPVYSTQLINEGSFSGGPVDVYTPTAGRLGVVKCITIVWGVVTISGVDAWVQYKDTLAKLARYTWYTSTTSLTNNGGTQLLWGSWVVNPGEILQCQTADGTVDFTASGFELELP